MHQRVAVVDGQRSRAGVVAADERRLEGLAAARIGNRQVARARERRLQLEVGEGVIVAAVAPPVTSRTP